MNNEERMQAGLIYNPSIPSLMERQAAALELLYDFNATRPGESDRRSELLRQMLAEAGEGCYVEPPIHANWGGNNVHFGNYVYANFNLTLVDDGPIYVGDRVMFGPNVTISTAGHPVLPELRAAAAQYNLPVRIGANAWIGAGVIILPGVTIGENSVIGAGSVVTNDIPANVVAVGSPCRVLREINDHDREFYWRDRRIDIQAEDL